MSTLIFGRTRYNYIPYNDFFRLVELSGFRWQYLDQINWFDKSLTVIASPLNGEFFDIPPNHDAKLIHWNLERFDPAQPTDAPKYRYDEVWASDLAMAEASNAKFVFLGGHREFGNVNYNRKIFDYITLAANFGRRSPHLHNLSQSLSCADMDGGTWDANRDQRLQQSRLMINLHQDEFKWSEPIRFMIAGAYALGVLSEHCEKPGFLQSGTHYLECTAEEMPAYARWIINHEVVYSRVAAALWRLTCVEHPFKQSVLEALAQ